MKTFKPKNMAEKLGIPPSLVTAHAKDIENANLHRFRKTPLGSFLFYEREAEILKEYHQAFYFFRKKKIALEMIGYRADLFSVEEEKNPEWAKFLNNAVLVQ